MLADIMTALLQTITYQHSQPTADCFDLVQQFKVKTKDRITKTFHRDNFQCVCGVN